MKLVNTTRMLIGQTVATDPSGRDHLVIVIKGTFTFPDRQGKELRLAEEHVPIVEADTFSGEPGLSAPVLEAEYVLRKKRCDVLVNGTAYAPGGRPVERVQVALNIASLTKSFDVVGHRAWNASGINIRAGRAQRFATMPVSYDCAFGGTDNLHPDSARHTAYMPNPCGRGYHNELSAKFVDGRPLPNTEESNRRVTAPNKSYRPMSFGPVGRSWEPRYKFAGTYDEQWLANTFPFLPVDFDDEYFQAAPRDQQVNIPKGNETVNLLNMTPEGRTSFQLPSVEVPVVFFDKLGRRNDILAVADTIFIESDLRRLSITWRATLPLKKSMFEISQVLVGNQSKAWWHARQVGKPHFTSIAELISAQKKATPKEDLP